MENVPAEVGHVVDVHIFHRLLRTLYMRKVNEILYSIYQWKDLE